MSRSNHRVDELSTPPLNAFTGLQIDGLLLPTAERFIDDKRDIVARIMRNRLGIIESPAAAHRRIDESGQIPFSHRVVAIAFFEIIVDGIGAVSSRYGGSHQETRAATARCEFPCSSRRQIDLSLCLLVCLSVCEEWVPRAS